MIRTLATKAFSTSRRRVPQLFQKQNYLTLCGMYAQDDYQNQAGGGGGRQHWGRRGRGGHRGRRQGYSDHGGPRPPRPRLTPEEREARGGPPAHLRGREIGLWHARKNFGKAKEREKKERSEVTMENEMEEHLREIICDMRQRRGPVAPARRDSFEMDQGFDFEESADIIDLTEEGADYIDLTEDLDEDTKYTIPKIKTETFDSEPGTIPTKLERPSRANCMLTEEYEYSKMNPKYQKMMAFREKLPCHKMKQEILDLIHENQVVVLSGETGCGKTTQVPQYILDDYLERERGMDCHIICTQPRRISAISVAERVADERAEKIGMSVGYMIRLENKLPRENGSILYCTTGIVLKMLEDDKCLNKATHIILDEIHERDLLSDFLIIILKDLIKRRLQLKVILMSATLNAKQFSKYYGNCPMIHIPGFTFPVTEYTLEDVIETLQYQVPCDMQKKAPRMPRGRAAREARDQHNEELQMTDAWLRQLHSERKYSDSTLEALEVFDPKKVDTGLILQLIKYISSSKPEGAVLVFLPGWMEIKDLNTKITSDRFFDRSQYKVIPLHSMMPTVNQREVFDRPPLGVRKIVLATNIAETSITIDDVVYVIDCGKIKVTNFTAESNLMSLEPQLVAAANSKQRRGRAGRVQPGECYHLYTKLQEQLMEPYLPPEILRTRLEELCLKIKLLKLGDIVQFVSKALQPPSMEALQLAIRNLKDLNALDRDENLLPLGKHLARLPLDPHTGKMMLFGAMFGCLEPIATIAASLNFKDPFYLPLGKEKEADRAKRQLSDGCNSDHILLIKAYQGWEESCQKGYSRQFCFDNFMSESTLYMLKKMKKQLVQYMEDLGFVVGKFAMEAANANSDNMDLVKAIVCAGLYPNVAKIPNKKFIKLYTRQDKCDLHPSSVLEKIGNGVLWTVYYKKMKTTKLFVYDSSVISPYALMLFGGEMQHILEDGESLVCIDDWIKFKASPDTIQLFKDIRHELDIILDKKVSRSYMTFWEPETREHALLDAVTHLIVTEDYQTSHQPRDDYRDQQSQDYRGRQSHNDYQGGGRQQQGAWGGPARPQSGYNNYSGDRQTSGYGRDRQQSGYDEPRQQRGWGRNDRQRSWFDDDDR